MMKNVVFPAVLAYVLFSLPASAEWGSVSHLSHSPDYHSLDQTLAMDSAGKAHVLFTDGPDGSRAAYYTTNASGSWAPPVVVGSSSHNVGDTAIVVMPDGTVTVFYMRGSSSPKLIYMRQRINGSWTTPQQIIPDNGRDQWLAPRATIVDDEGTIHLMYNQYIPANDDYCFYYTSKPIGGSWTTPVVPYNSGFNAYQNGASLAVRGAGAGKTLYFAVHAETSGTGLSGTRVWFTSKTGNGAWTTAKRLTNNSSSMGPTIGVDSLGVVHLAFQEPRGGSWNIFYMRSLDGGATWSSDTQITDTSSISRGPNMVVDEQNSVHLFWEQESSSGWRAEYRLLRQGEWKRILRLDEPPGNSFGPVPALKNGILGVIWVDAGLPGGGTMYDVAYRQDNTWMDSTPPSVVPAFTVQSSNQKNYLSWQHPSDFDFHGVMVRASTTGYPASPTSGTLVARLNADPGWTGSFEHNGLVNGQTYYYSVFSYDHIPNYSLPVQGSSAPHLPSIGDIATMADGIPVDYPSRIVTGIFTDGSVYVADPDRAAAIRTVHTGAGLAVGDRVNVSGVTSTRMVSNQPAERQISSAVLTKVTSGNPLVPLRIRSKSIGGQHNPPLQPGVDGVEGMNNMGLLVTIAGRVVFKSGTSMWVDDGDMVTDTSGRVGVLVRCPSSAIPYNVGDMVKATGVIQGSVPTGWTSNRRMIVLRTFSDLAAL